MANLFQPKRVVVPGLLSDEGLTARIKELTDTQKAMTEAAPPNTSAVEFANQVTTAQSGNLGKMVDQSAAERQAAQTARSDAIGSDIAGAVSSVPGVKELGSFGTLSEERALEEQQILIDDAKQREQTLKDAEALGETMNEGFGPPPDWQSMTPEELRFYQQRALQQQIKPKLEAAADVRTAETTTPKYEWWRNAAEVAARSAAKVGVDTLKFPVAIWDLSAETVTGEANRAEVGVWLDGVDKALTKMLPGDPARSKEFVTEIAQGVGSMTGFMIGGFATSSLKMGAGLGSAVIGGAVGGTNAYEDAQRFDANNTQKWLALILGSGLGATEAIPIDRAFFRADQATGGLVTRMLQNTVSTSLEEFTQELAQATGEDLIAKFIYDEDRNLDAGAWLKQATIGAIVGGGSGAVISLIEGGGTSSDIEVAQYNEEQSNAAADEAINAARNQFTAALGAEAADLPGLGGAVDQPPADGGGEAGPAAAAPAAEAQAEVARPAVAGDAVRQVVARAKPVKKVKATPATTAEQTVVLDPTVPAEQQVSVQVAPAIETPEFKTWFGQSKVVDEAGAPLRVYHGTNAVFREFNPARQGERDSGFFGNGFYFAEQRESAESYAAGYGEFEGADPPDEIVMETYLALENPFTVDVTSEEALADTIARAQEVLPRIEFDRYGLKGGRTRDWTKALKAAGYDGVVVKQGSTGLENEYVAFEPTQIKSATANDGSFDADDPNIDSQVGQPVSPDIVAQVDAVQLEPHQTSALPDIEKGLTGPIPIVVQAAKAYANAIGLPHRRQRSYVKVDTSRAARIASAYTAMKHEPQDPAVAAAYKALAEETTAQYQYVKATGLKIEAILPGQPDPYPGGPRETLKDMVENNHIWYFPTEGGFGSDASVDVSDNPLLEPTDEVSDNGQPMVVNDLFRVVHDFFGHGLEGAGFGPRGEENAWQSHMRLFTASAVPAMTSETRGQNSWVNYGPFGEQNRKDPRNTTYADQKTGLMPEWTWTEGVVDSTAEDVDAPQDIEAMHGTVGGTQYVTGSVGMLTFHKAIAEAAEASPFGAAVHIYDPNEYIQMKLFLAPDKLSGFAIKDGDIVSVFSHPDAGGGRLRKIIDTAIANGGKTLDAFDGKLVQMYSSLGFKEVRREPWNPEYKPEGWKDEWGTPDVVYMEYVGDVAQAEASLGTETPAFLEWDGGSLIREATEGDDSGAMPGGDGAPLLLVTGAPHDLRIATRDMWLVPARSGRRTAELFARGSKADAEFDEDGNNIGGAVFTLYARMENPLEIDWQGNSWGSGPYTAEYAPIFHAVDETFSSYGDAEQAISDAQDSAREQAEEDFRDDMAARMYVEEVGERFEVRLKAEQGETISDLEYRVGNARNYEESRREALDKAIAQQDTLGAALVESVRNQYKSAIAQLGEFQRKLDALRAAPPVEDEVIGAFDTAEEARDFENEYTEEGATAAGDEAADAVDTNIEEEIDYDLSEGDGQTTDSVVNEARHQGYDGVIFRDVDEGSGPVDVYVVIEPGNAKSTANFGTYNREDPDILRMTGTSSTRQPYALEPTRPTRGVPEQPNTEPNDVRLTAIASDLVKTLNLTVRHGRLAANNANVMGEFNRRTGVIRLRTWTDLSTLAHEAGHAINDQMAQDLDAFVTANLAAFNGIATTLYAVDLSQATGATKRREGFAEFFRVYTMTPDYARNTWKQLTADFEALLDRLDPTVRVGLNSVAAQVKAWQQLPSTQLIENTIIDGRREQGIGPALKELKELGFKSWMQEFVRRNVQWSTNRYAALNRSVTDLLNAGEANRGAPIELARADDPRVLARLARNVGSRAMVELTDGVIGYKGTQAMSRGLREAIMLSQGVDPNTTPGSLDEERLHLFSAYLVARRALEEFRRFDAGELDRPPVAYSKGDVVRAIKDWEAKYPDFAAASQIVHEYGMALWQKSYDAGLIGKETYEDGLKRQFYVPLQRDMSDKKATFGDSALTSQGSGPLRSIVKRFRGSDRDVIDPLAILMQKTIALEALIAENDIKKAFAVLADRVGTAGALVERIPAHQLIGQQFTVQQVAKQLTGLDDISEADAADLMTLLGASIKDGDTISMFRSQQASAKGEPILFFWENGKIAAIQLKDGDVGMDVVNTLNSVGRENMDKLLEAVAATSTLFRTAITSWPDFLLLNFVRDQPSAWLLTDVGYIPFVSGIKGVFDEVRQKGWAKQYNIAAGTMGGMNTAALHTARVDRDIRALRAKGYIANVFGDVRSGWDFPGAIKGLARISAITETGTRLGLFKGAFNRGKREGLTDYEASVEAAYIATDYIDFGLNGTKMLTTRRLIPFLNAQIQSFYKLVRTLGGDEVAQRKGLKFVLTAYFKNINNLPLNRVEKQQLRTGRKAWLKMMSLGLISAAIYAVFKDDPDYEEAGEYLRTTGWVIPMGDGRITYIPKPFELAMIANAVERGLEAAAGDPQAMDRFKRGVAFNLTPPTSPPALLLAFEVPNNIDTFSGREIVPSYMQALAPELQYDHTTSSLAKWMGGTFGWSPMVVDHVLSGMGASAYRDLSAVLNAADPTRPSMDVTDAPILRRFVRDVRRGSVSAQDFWSQASTRNGALARAAASYKREIEIGNEPAAQRRLQAMSAEERSYSILMTHFTGAEQRLNPYYRATQATTLVSGMRRDLGGAQGLEDTTITGRMSRADLTTYLQTGGTLDYIALTAGKKKEIDIILSEIARREVRNTMIATGQAGWADKEILPVEPTVDLLLNVAPEVYDEFQRRWKQRKIYDATTVYEYWPDIRERLIGDGEYAVLTDAVKVAGAGL